MDITDASPSRRSAAIELFVERDFPFVYQGVLFAKQEGRLVVHSYSACIRGENVTRAEAAEKIERSRRVLEEFESLSPEFVVATAGLPRKFQFLYDTGGAAALMAIARDDGVEWLG